MRYTKRVATCATVFALLGVNTVTAASFTVQPIVGGAAIGATAPDSVEFGDGSLWISYQNGADSAGASGASTVARYTPSGTLLKTWSVAGNVDGLRVDPASGLVWALQNNDGNSALTVINPVTNSTTAYSYGSSYTANGNSAGRGFDDVVFRNGQIFISETNPAVGTDPVVLRLTTGLLSPLQVSGILNSAVTGLNLSTNSQGSTTIADSDSLVLTPSGDLALTGEADKTIVYIHNPGAANQSQSFINLLGTNGQTITGKPDDTAYSTASQGLFYVADTGANTVYAITASGLSAGATFVDVGNEFGSLDPATGIVTPIFTGVSPHGTQFVTFAAAGVPEPSSLLLAAVGFIFAGAMMYRRRQQEIK